MKLIKISNIDKYILVDDEDFDRTRQYTWNAIGEYKKVIHRGKDGIALANFIMKNMEHMYDHKDRNSFNNQKENLRPATQSQNGANKDKYIEDGYSKYKGVSYDKSRYKWIAYIRVNYKFKFLGRFTDEKQAAERYNRAALHYFKEFAVLNEIE